MKSLLTILALFFLTATSYAQTDSTAPVSLVKISGYVKGDLDSVMRGANLVIQGSIDGATTDEKGYYEFETERTGQQNLLVTMSEYKKKTIPLDITANQNIEMNVKLSKEEIRTEEILVTASSFTSGTNNAVTLTPLEIVRIPGADADLYRAITTFPGSNQVNEGSRISVRGGDPDEVLTIIDLASLYNPFIFDETFNTSSYSTVNPWGLRGINFTSGGFSAKYGNVLSAVLDLKSYDMPQGSGMFGWLGLANASLSGVYLSKNRNFGATFDIGKLFLEPYFAINGKHSEFAPIPQSNNAGGTLSYKIGIAGNIKLYANYSDDKIGIKNDGPSYSGFFSSNSKSFFTNVKLMIAPTSSTLLNAGASFSLYDRNAEYGILNTRQKDFYSKGRVDFTKNVTSKIDINSGVEYEYNGYDVKGIVPEFGYNLRPDAAHFDIDTNVNGGRMGAYLETQVKVSKKFFVIPGVRTDYHTISKKINFDPRLSFGYQISRENALRGAFGLYHQNPKLENFLRADDNNLKPEDALHYILGYEFNRDGNYIFRVEGYYKDYSNLVSIDTNDLFYRSEGEGNVKGVDVFLKTKIANKFTGWISYAYSDSKRKQYEAKTIVPANYDIRNNVSVVGSYNITDQIVVGASYKISSGKPFTPVIGSVYVPSQDVYRPIYGEINSARFPTYSRTDMNAQYIFSLFGKFAILAFSVNNVFNQKNIYDYTYNSDYSQRLEIITNNRRTLYVGLGMQL
ncbi:MAG: carboxypeptidase-like regulatory domain-containing protein [bacterium]|nr:carboxypeptidase-like regulatory domain-containing protein [bacterium]